MIGQLYQARRIARIRYLLGGLIALAISVGIALFSGDTPISPSTLVKALLSSNDIAAERLLIVFMRIRAPRIMLAVVAGGSLGAAGALMQSVLGNPLASPFTLGVSSAAGFGASLAIEIGRASCRERV